MDYIKVPVDLARRVIEDFHECQGMMEPYYSQSIKDDEFKAMDEFSNLVPNEPVKPLTPSEVKRIYNQNLFSSVLNGNRCMLCFRPDGRTKGFNARHSAEHHALAVHPDKVKKGKAMNTPTEHQEQTATNS